MTVCKALWPKIWSQMCRFVTKCSSDLCRFVTICSSDLCRFVPIFDDPQHSYRKTQLSRRYCIRKYQTYTNIQVVKFMNVRLIIFRTSAVGIFEFFSGDVKDHFVTFKHKSTQIWRTNGHKSAQIWSSSGHKSAHLGTNLWSQIFINHH